MSNAVAKLEQRSLVSKFASRYSIDADKLLPILKHTCFKVQDGEVSNEQMAALLVVADQYGLNPFCREIFAFPDKKNGIVPVVGVDGWSRIINDHPQADGIEFRYAEDMVQLADAQKCPEWCEVIVYRKDRAHPVIVREYLEECYRPLGSYPDGNRHKPGPWQTHTKRFLRHKTLIQGARIAFGFGGIFDEDEAHRVLEATATEVLPIDAPLKGTAALKAAAEQRGGGKVGQEGEAAAESATDGVGSEVADSEPGPNTADWIAQVEEFVAAEALEAWLAKVPAPVREDAKFKLAIAARIVAVKQKRK